MPNPSKNFTLKPYVLKFSRLEPLPPPCDRDESLKLQERERKKCEGQSESERQGKMAKKSFIGDESESRI